MTRKRERDAAQRRNDKNPARQQEQATSDRRRRVAVAAAAGGAAIALVGVTALALTGSIADSGDGDSVAGSLACVGPGPAPILDPVQLSDVPAPAAGPVTVTFETTCGAVVAELDGDAAPQAVGSLVALAGEGFFDATPCHRLTTAGIFVLQCGDPTATGTGGPGYRFGPVENAPADDVYPAGTLAMARVGNDGASMGSQFFLVYQDSMIPSDAAGGYTVMGSVTSGLEIVQGVAAVGNAPGGQAPAQSIGIRSVTVQEAS